MVLMVKKSWRGVKESIDFKCVVSGNKNSSARLTVTETESGKMTLPPTPGLALFTGSKKMIHLVTLVWLVFMVPPKLSIRP